MIKPIYIFLLVPLFLSACSLTTSRQNPEFANTWGKQYSVAILPPEVTVDLIELDGKTQAMPEEELKAIKIIKSESKKILAKKGYLIVDFDFVEHFGQNADFRESVINLRESAKNELKPLHNNPPISIEDSTKYNGSVGSLASGVSQTTGADLLLYVGYEGFEKSDGLRAADFGLAVLEQALTGQSGQYNPEGGYCKVALIDGSTGNILWLDSVNVRQPINEYDPEGSLLISGANPLEIVFSELPDKSKSAPKD